MEPVAEFHVRELKPDDCSACADIWERGLTQTWQQMFLTRALMKRSMESLAAKSLASDGDIGPQGANLFPMWMEKTDHGFLVAVTTERGAVIGCIAVKPKGDINGEQKRFEFVKWSVDEAWRGKGVGKALVEGAEDFVKKQGGSEMWAITANPISSKAMKRLGYQSTWSSLGYWHWKNL